MIKISALIFGIISLMFLLIFPAAVHANEGRFSLTSDGIDCEGISIWQSDTYKITGVCNGLVYPYHEQLNNYFFWVQPDNNGNPIRISEVDQGIISGSTDNRFTGLFITVENSRSPLSPDENRIVSGNLSLFNFPLPYKTQQSVQTTTPENKAQIVLTATPIPVPNPSPGVFSPFNLNSRTLITIISVGFIILVIFGLINVFRH